MGTLRDIKGEFLRVYEGIAIRRGQPAVLGRILAAFFIEGRELSQKELSSITGYSISSVSRSLDQLGALGVIRERKDASREHSVYSMSVDFVHLVISGLEAFVKQAEMSRRDIEGVRKKIESTSFSREERTEANALHSRLKRLEEGMRIVAETTRKNIEEMRSKL